MPDIDPEEDMPRALRVQYTNWHGDQGTRNIIPGEMYWGTTPYHPGPQWLLRAWDLDKNAERTYALTGITHSAPHPDAAGPPKTKGAHPH